MVIIGAISVISISTGVSEDKLIEKAKYKQEVRMQKESTNKNKFATNKPNINTNKQIWKDYFYIFILGSIAITAMILPGVSGSFLLLVMGGYFEILAAIAARDLGILSVFALGCVVGILIATKFIKYFLDRWHDATMSFLLGLVLGSLWMIWPFKTSAEVGHETIYLSNIQQI